MNKEIIKNLIKIEKLKYEIIKDILPSKAADMLNNLEKEVATVIKDIVLDSFQEFPEKSGEKTEKKIKKINVDFQ